MLPIGVFTDFYHLPEAAALGFDFLEIPLDALAALPEVTSGSSRTTPRARA